MIRLKEVVLVSGTLLISNASFSQATDSISRKVMAYVADKFPIARAFNIEYSQATPYNFSSRYRGAGLPGGKIDNLYQLRASANINFIKKEKWVFGTTLTYRYLSMDMGQKEDHHYHSQSLNLTYFSKLFGKTAIYSASLISDGSGEKFHERMRGLLAGNLILKATRETQMTVGFIGFIDPSALFPVLPSFSYKHQLGNGWAADVTLPQAVLIRKKLARNGRLSAGGELGNTFFYLYDLDNTGRTYAMNQTEINSGLIYEHYLGRTFTATFKTGWKNILNARVFEKSDAQKDYILKASPDASFYFNVGISFNPFGKRANK